MEALLNCQKKKERIIKSQCNLDYLREIKSGDNQRFCGYLAKDQLHFITLVCEMGFSDSFFLETKTSKDFCDKKWKK